MKIFLLLLSAAAILMAGSQTFTLEQIRSHYEQHHPALKAIEVRSGYMDASIKAQGAYEPLELSLFGAYAKEDSGNDGTEFSVALGQTLLLPGSSGHRQRALRADADAELLQLQREFTLSLNALSNSYHQSCLKQEAAELYRLAEEDFTAQYNKHQRAYELGEISKSRLLLLELELMRIHREVKASRASYEAAIAELRSMLVVVELDVAALSCRDLIPIEIYQPDYEKTLEQSFSQRAITQRIESEKERYRYFDTSFKEIGVTAGYDSELGTERIGFGVSIPLDFTSSLQRHEREAALQQRSYLQLQRSELRAQKNRALTKALSLLNSEVEQIGEITASVEKYTSELLPLIYTSFLSGESSALEYLLVLREQRSIEMELIRAKENYYDKRFGVYTLLEIKE